MFYGAKRFDVTEFDSNFFCGLRQRGSGWRDARRYFHIRKFPQMGVHNAGRPLADEKTPIPSDHHGDKVAGCGGFAFAEVGQFVHAIFPEGDAKLFYRANPALRISRRANQCAEFHQGLI
jgi:hypothetical protein